MTTALFTTIQYHLFPAITGYTTMPVAPLLTDAATSLFITTFSQTTNTTSAASHAHVTDHGGY